MDAQSRPLTGKQMRPDEFVVVPDGWLSRGQAFVRGDGAQLVIPGGIPGERVRVRVTSRTPHQVFAKVQEPILAPHPDRVVPPCERLPYCGRCTLMHLNDRGIDAAQRGIIELALREAGVQPRLEPIVHSHQLDSIHSLDLLAGYSDEGSARLGVTAAKGGLIPIPLCNIVTPVLREIMKVAAHHMRALDIRPADGRSGTLRRVRAMQVPGTDEVLMILGTIRKNPVLRDYAVAMGAAVPQLASVYLHREEDDPTGEDLFLTYGKPAIEWSAGWLRLKVGPKDPMPAHPALAMKMAEDVVTALNPQKGDAVVDIGSGMGLRTMLLAKKSGWALGVESSEDLVRHARENAATNQVSAEFFEGPVTEALESPRLAGLRPLVYLDAERRGLDGEVMTALEQLSPRRIALACTNPRALARDIALLSGKGYDLRRIVSYDVSPFTPFVESVALLVSRDLRGPERRAPQRRTVR